MNRLGRLSRRGRVSGTVTIATADRIASDRATMRGHRYSRAATGMPRRSAVLAVVPCSRNTAPPIAAAVQMAGSNRPRPARSATDGSSRIASHAANWLRRGAAKARIETNSLKPPALAKSMPAMMIPIAVPLSRHTANRHGAATRSAAPARSQRRDKQPGEMQRERQRSAGIERPDGRCRPPCRQRGEDHGWPAQGRQPRRRRPCRRRARQDQRERAQPGERG